jgi:hypothetical protein
MQYSFNVSILDILVHVSALQNTIIRELIMILLRKVPNIVEIRDGWMLYIVTI